jgi:hypothetical protein
VFDYKQRPATEEYREGWDRIFGKEEDEKEGEGDPEEWLSAQGKRGQN